MSLPARQLAPAAAPTTGAAPRRRPPLFADYLPAQPLPTPRPTRLRLSQALGSLAFAGLMLLAAAAWWCA